jgi:hypothetical protein
MLHFLTSSLKSAAKIGFCLDNQKTSFTFLHKYFTKKGIAPYYPDVKNKAYGPVKMPIIGSNQRLANFILRLDYVGLLSVVGKVRVIYYYIVPKIISIQAQAP